MKSESVSNFGSARTKGSVVSPALAAKQNPKALKIPRLLSGRKILKISSSGFLLKIRPASTVSSGIFERTA